MEQIGVSTDGSELMPKGDTRPLLCTYPDSMCMSGLGGGGDGCGVCGLGSRMASQVSVASGVVSEAFPIFTLPFEAVEDVVTRKLCTDEGRE